MTKREAKQLAHQMAVNLMHSWMDTDEHIEGRTPEDAALIETAMREIIDYHRLFVPERAK